MGLNIKQQLRMLSVCVCVLFMFFYTATATAQLLARYYTPLYLQIVINKHCCNFTSLVMSDRHHEIYLSEQTLERLRIRVYHVHGVVIEHHLYYCLNDIPQLHYHIDHDEARLYIRFTPTAFPRAIINDYHTEIIHPTKPLPGAFFNYDLLAQQDNNFSFKQRQLSGLFDVGFFNRYGVGVSDFLVTDQWHQHRSLRLNSTWTIDRPNKMQTIRIGDSIAAPGLWGDAVSFGGIQWSTNFNTQPYYITFPLPSARGIAFVPTTADVYINNALSARERIPAGPFQINNIPVVTGQGNLQVVTTDILGQQQIVNVPYYASLQMLKPGLQDFSYSLGFLRRNYGIYSNDYGPLMATITQNQGITPHLTTQWHTEILRRTQNAGFGANILIGHFGILTAAAAGSHAKQGVGGLLLLRFVRETHHYSFGFSSEATTHKFELLSTESGHLPPKMESQAFVSFQAFHGGSIGLSYINQINRGRRDVNLASLNYTQTITRHVFLNVSAISNIGGQEYKAVFVNIAIPLGNRTTATAGSNWQNGAGYQATAGIQRNLPPGTGFGYNVRGAAGGSNSFFLGEGSYQSSFGTYSLAAGRQLNDTSYRAEVQGGMAYMADKFAFTRRIYNSFGIVAVPGLGNVPIYLENHKVAETDSQGYAFVPNLLAYNRNHLSIHPGQLPLDTSIATDKLDAIPYFRSGVFVKFPVHVIRAGLLTIKLANGKPIPIGSIVTINHQPEQFAVGYKGLVYLTNIRHHNVVNVEWNGHHCQFILNITHFERPLTHLGIHICRHIHN